MLRMKPKCACIVRKGTPCCRKLLWEIEKQLDGELAHHADDIIEYLKLYECQKTVNKPR